jgi:putative transposase
MKPPTKREHLKQLVSEKNRWSRPLTEGEKDLGFLGWHERGYLPHCDFPGLVQLVTFRLEDSMPASRRGEWEHLLKIENVRERRMKLEEYLDRGAGKCALRTLRVSRLAEDALLYFHKERYDLLAWCVMPNHIHVLVHTWETPLAKMVQSWKRYIATEAEAFLPERRSPTRPDGVSATNAPARRAALQWQREYWDTFMRNDEQQRKAVKYIESNPVKARLCREADEWAFSSAKRRDKFRRLAV